MPFSTLAHKIPSRKAVNLMVVENALRKAAKVMVVESAVLGTFKKGLHEWHNNSEKLCRRLVVSET